MKGGALVIEQGPTLTSYVRGLSAVMAIICAISGIGLPLALVFAAVVFAKGGTEVDTEHQRIREYNGLLGLRWGKWMPLAGFAAVAVLRVNRTSTMFSRSQQAQDLKEVNHDAVLLSATHRRKQVLKACDTREEALSLARMVSERTGFPLVQYAPQPMGPRRK